MTRWTISLKFIYIRAAVPQLSRHRCAIELDPLLRSGERMHQAAVMQTPLSYIEVEVVLAIVLSIGLNGLRRHHARRLVPIPSPRCS
jgi:hypothetical protein